MKKVRWGILSTANIGMEKVIPAIQQSAHSAVVAIASRDLSKAQHAADQLGIAKAYGSYEALLADPDIDAIYNPLPNHLHVPMTVAATKAGKHVLCEKPIARTAAEAEGLRDCAPGLIVMEAFMIRFHPQWLRAREIIRSGELGDVRTISALFTYFNDDAGNVRNQADIGGGGILDIGCYPVTAGRFLFESEPKRVMALVDRDPQFGTDRLASVLADFGGGRQLSFTCSTQTVGEQSVTVLGSKAKLAIAIPFNAPANERTSITVDTGAPFDGSLARREILPACDQYTEQAEAFALAVLGEQTLPWNIEDAIASMKVIDAIFASERSGTWANV
ncbi:Gfo/Idh/MocA family protein [Devosia psychrophila]|uniref:NAD-binding protein n=1 Tax=Devosia psychrophila TaxID=728005 RepID=A0A0F5PUR2_9HYPH|nr:Gfo/Idh/MocA family oxidoreductase [Devosia psychrophila]KKC32350.1 NAD-binding protein [Devosia psychrophila]SFD28210.1 Predicted dehydrogenase [Devosia psychrophila]